MGRRVLCCRKRRKFHVQGTVVVANRPVGALCTIRVALDLLTWNLEKLLPSDEACVVHESKEVRPGES